MKTHAIGIDIGGTRTKIGFVNLATGRVEAMQITPTETKDGERFIDLIGNAVSQFVDQAVAEEVEVAGVGIGVPGFVFAGGVVDTTYGFLDFMEDYPLAELITRQHGLPCRLDNDARVVALGEARYGQGTGRFGVSVGRVLTLTLGTGLGLGFTINGRLDGALPYAHMGGHLTITHNDTVCYCGKTGCLESLVSSAGLLRLAGRQGWADKHPSLPMNPEAIFAQKNAGNADAKAIVDEYISYLKTGIDNYVNLFAPDLIVLGGGLAKGLTNDLDRLHTPMLLNPYKAYQTRIVVSTLEEQAGILGSAALFAESAVSQPNLPVS